jgi:hypothetical protein
MIEFSMKEPTIRPIEQPMRMPGRKRPAGTIVPYVTTVKEYQMRKKRMSG